MIGMQINLQGKGVAELAGFVSLSSPEAKWKKEASNEPISVLDTRRSPSPSTSTSTSTLSSSLGGGATAGDGSGSLAAVSDINPLQNGPVSATVLESGGGRKDEWAAELQPIPTGQEVAGGDRFGLGLEAWDSLLSESGQDHSLFRWIASEIDDGSFTLKQLLQSTYPTEIDANVAPAVVDLSSGLLNASAGGSNVGNFKAPSNNNNVNPQIPGMGSALSNLLPSGVIYQQQELETLDSKPQIFNPQAFASQQQFQVSHNQNSFPSPQQDPLRLLQPHSKRQNLGVSDPFSQTPRPPFFDPGHELLLLRNQQLGLAQQEAVGGGQAAVHHHHRHQQVVYDQLFKAAELILAGNFSHAHGILARLNHQLSPLAKPFQRAAFYFKEALQLPLLMPSPATLLPPKSPTPIEAMFKMGAYKLLSELSPLVQFMNFTSNQALIEALGDAEQVHVIDFDIGFGAQWASFMQELPGRSNRGCLSLKITAFASPSTHHPLELGLMHENLTQFANESGVNFKLEIVNLDIFDPSAYSAPLFRSSEKEAIVVNFPIWACSGRLSVLPSLVRFVKQLSPKIVVSLERKCERSDLPFSHHILNALQYYEVLLDSIDAANVNSEITNKIERFLIQPKIESIVSGRFHAPDPMPHWKALFASAGFSPVPFSNFAETQAECVLKRSQVRGFNVEKRQASLVLYWQRQELMSASAWRC
ncbi:Scarecrow-like protein [Actinidia chinensis var. chinensis]|uniref:Scarecrow-like protein n=1 Tax=Actinidia chinensis var. chinensis TaxID=1590841 RepID=A0A2R6QNM3_ACTCC|nr:Scarecrow-like protein [Actinidia chinensis var. chinensis]